MSEFRTPNEPLDISYVRINIEQTALLKSAMQRLENQEQFDVTLLPISTLEERLAAAEEWAEYLQETGITTEQRLDLLEDKDMTSPLNYGTFAFAKIVKKMSSAKPMGLLRDNYSYQPNVNNRTDIPS